MTRTLAFVLGATSLGALAVLPAAPVVAQPNAGTLAQVQAHLKAVDTMTASFSQTDRKGQTLTGRLTLKKPGRIRFAYDNKVPLLIVADRGALNMIDYEVRQVQRWPVKNSPLSVLLDPDKDMARYGRVVPSSDPNVVSVEVKDPKRPEYGVINMVFVRQASAPGGLSLSGWVALDSQNNRTSIRLANQRFNVPVADSVFKWTDPRGGSRRR